MLFTEQRTCHVMNMPNMSKIEIKKFTKNLNGYNVVLVSIK